jgi:peptidoglycan/LPS O-acetylase OafA/YrhL
MGVLEIFLYIVFGLFVVLMWIGFFVVGFLGFKEYPLRSALFLLLCVGCLIGAIAMSISGQSASPGWCGSYSCPP